MVRISVHNTPMICSDMFRSLYEPLGLPKVDLYSLRHFSITKKLEEVASDSAGKQMLEFAIAMYEKNNSGK